MNLSKKATRKLLGVYLALLAFALAGSGVGLVSVNSIAKADRRLHTVGVENLGDITKVKEEFAWLPIRVRDIIIETDPWKRDAYKEEFDQSKKRVLNAFTKLAPIVSDDPAKEKLYEETEAALADYWKKVSVVIKRAMEGKAAEAVPQMLHFAYPQFKEVYKDLGRLQDKMKEDASAQMRANGSVVVRASVALAICTAIMVLLSVMFAIYVEKVSQGGE